MRQAEIATFTDDFAAQLVGVDAQRVIAPVPDIGVAFAAGLDVSADAAVPEKVDAHLENGVNELVGCIDDSSMSSILRTSGLRRIVFAWREKTPPPFEIRDSL